MTPPSQPSTVTSPLLRLTFPLLLALILAANSGCTPTSAVVTPPDQETFIKNTAGIDAPPTTQQQSRAALATVPQPDDDLQEQEEVTPPEPEQTVAQEMAELEKLGKWEDWSPGELTADKYLEYDFPVTLNRQVEFYLDFFKGKQNGMFATWLSRSSRYLPMFKSHLQEAGLPLDLAYLPMIESGFSLTAQSSAGAVGPWQFMETTAKQYGLRVDRYVDERRDPEAATRAAVRFLSDLYDEFGSWHLAAAAYNAGGGTLRKALRKTMSTDFWTIAQSDSLADETKLYVPKLIAAIILAKDPGKYGFNNIPYQEPLRYETISVPPQTAVKAVSLAGDIPFDAVRDLNRELRKGATPPGETYQLKIPAGKGNAVLANLPRIKSTVRTVFKDHAVGKDDTLETICKLYDLDTTTLLKANNLRKSKLSQGQILRIPQSVADYELLSTEEYARAASREETQPQAETGAGGMVLHRIQKGETISILAQKYGVSPQQIAQWNNMENLNRIREGQLLSFFVKDNPANTATAALPTAAPAAAKQVVASASPAAASPAKTVASASTAPKPAPAAAPAQTTETPAATPKTITAGIIKKKPKATETAAAKTPQTRLTWYKVQDGDSLWEIARRYNLSPEDIKEWNNLPDDAIKPGNQLMIKTAEDIGA